MKRQRSYFGWMELVIGILLVALGIFTFLRPGSALTGAVIFYGILATVTGIADIVFYIRMERYTGFGPAVSLVSGILSVMSGVMLLVYPRAGRWIFSLLFPIWFISHCISRLSHLDIIRIAAGRFCYYFTLTVNIIGILLGFFMVLRPWVSVLSVSLTISVYLVLLGIDSIVIAFSKVGCR